MIPNKTLASEKVPAPFLNKRRVGPLEDYEQGGVALQDPSQGLLVQSWRCGVEETEAPPEGPIVLRLDSSLGASYMPSSKEPFSIDFGDGEGKVRVNSNQAGTPAPYSIEKIYADAAAHTVRVYPDTGSTGMFLGGNPLVSVESWGDIPFPDCAFVIGYALGAGADKNSSSLTTVPQVVPSWMNTMQAMFAFASSFNQDISTWDVSGIQEMGTMFYECSSFNRDLSGWCVSNIPEKPIGFDLNASSWTLPRPVWGTCP